MQEDVYQVIPQDPEMQNWVPVTCPDEVIYKHRWYIIDIGQPIPDFGAGGPPMSHYIASRNDFKGSPKVGSKVVLTTATPKQLNQHLEGCEYREMVWLHGRVGTIVEYQYTNEVKLAPIANAVSKVKRSILGHY